MTYEKTAVSEKVSKSAVDKALDELFNAAPTYRIVWRIVRRHKFGLMATYAAAMTVVVFVPFLPGLLLNMVAR